MTKTEAEIEKLILNYHCFISIVSMIFGTFLGFLHGFEIISVEVLMIILLVYCVIVILMGTKLTRMRFK